MSLKSYFDLGFRTTLIFAVLGVIVGYISFLQNSAPLAFIIMIIVGAVFALLLKRIMKVAEDWKWWFGNGLILYIFLWLIVWTIFYNVAIN